VSAPGAGVLLALSGDDAGILRALSQAGSGLCVVRRCADLPELLSAGMAGLAGFALLDTGFDEIDRTVLDRLARAGLSGMLLVEAHEEERWRSAGWPILRRDTEPGRICAALQDLVRRGGVSGVAPTGSGPAADGADWLSAATPVSTEPNTEPHTESNTAAQETAWLEELWRQPTGPDVDGKPPVPPQPAFSGNDPSGLADCEQQESREPATVSAADVAGQGRIVLVWGPHGAPGRSTVAASLAHGLAGFGGAILVDADVEAPSLVQILGMPEDSSALAGAARLATHGRLDAESFQRVLAPVEGGLSLLGGLGRAGRWRELPPAAMTEVWLQCRRAAAWTVVDVAGGAIDNDIDDFTLEPGRGAVTADLVSHADVVLVVGGADPVGVRRLLQLLDEVGSSVTPAGRIEVVVNRVRASAAGPSPQQALREALSRFGGLEDIVLLPDDPATADACLLQGRSIMEGAPASALGKAMSALVDRIDPQTAAVRKARSSSRPLLRRLKRLKRRGREQRRTTGSAGRATAAGGRSRRGVRAQRGRRRKGGRAVTSGAESRAPERPAYSTRQSQTTVPPSTPPPVQPPSPPQAMRDGPSPWPGAGPASFGERG